MLRQTRPIRACNTFQGFKCTYSFFLQRKSARIMKELDLTAMKNEAPAKTLRPMRASRVRLGRYRTAHR